MAKGTIQQNPIYKQRALINGIYKGGLANGQTYNIQDCIAISKIACTDAEIMEVIKFCNDNPGKFFK